MGEVRWIKLTTSMFDNEKIRIIESMPDKDAILIIWIKLLTLSGKINAGGYIFINKDVPYDDETLAAVMNRPLNTVRLALSVFEKYGMIYYNGSHLVISNWEKYQNVESLDRIRNQTRDRVAKHRENSKLLQESNVTVTLRNATEEEEEEEEERRKKKEEYPPLNKIDEDNTLIFSQSITTVRQILNGDRPASEANKKRYREELKKRGWLEAIEGEKKK